MTRWIVLNEHELRSELTGEGVVRREGGVIAQRGEGILELQQSPRPYRRISNRLAGWNPNVTHWRLNTQGVVERVWISE